MDRIDPALHKPLRRRAFLGATAAAAGAALLGGCSSNGSRPTTITFYVSKREVIPYFQNLMAQYHRSQSKVRVVMDSTSNMQANFVRQKPPDLGCWNYNFSVAEFIEHGEMMDLAETPQAKSINPKLWTLLQQTADYPGRISAIPYSIMGASVIYNKDLFAKYGVTVPTTWSALMQACRTLQDAGVAPFYDTYAENWTVVQGPFDYSIGGMVDVKSLFSRIKAEGTNVGPGSPVSFEKNLAEPMHRMVQLGKYANKDAAGRMYADGNTAFANGKAAMYLQGPWAFNEITKVNPRIRMGTFPLPMTEDPKDLRIRANVDLALWIPEASKKKEAAMDFMAWLMRPQISDKYNADNFGFGVRRDSPPSKSPVLAGLQGSFNAGKFYLGVSQLIPASIPVTNYAQAIALGSDPTTQLRTLDADWSRLALRNAT